MEPLFFEIKLHKVEIGRVITVSRSIDLRYNPNRYLFNFTVDSKNLLREEKYFSSYTEFMEFFESTNFRFNVLKLEKEIDVLYLAFQHTQGEFRVYGKVTDKEIFDELILSLKDNVVYGYIHNDLDFTLARTNNFRSWQRKLGNIPSYINVMDNPHGISDRDRYIVDLESFPTHFHLIKTGDKLWFGSCTQMYFSEIYYKYIPKARWEDFENCIENNVLENGLRKIILYKNFDEYELQINRDRQWNFRKHLGIDEVAHMLVDGEAAS